MARLFCCIRFSPSRVALTEKQNRRCQALANSFQLSNGLFKPHGGPGILTKKASCPEHRVFANDSRIMLHEMLTGIFCCVNTF